MNKKIIGYTQGTYDLFHVGHLNLLENAKRQCDYLIVGVNSDKLVQQYKNKTPVINDQDRARIVGSIKAVDKVYIANTLDKLKIAKMVDFDVIFIGSDWKGNERWNQTEKDLQKIGRKLVFLPHTDGISTTDLVAKISNERAINGK